MIRLLAIFAVFLMAIGSATNPPIHNIHQPGKVMAKPNDILDVAATPRRQARQPPVQDFLANLFRNSTGNETTVGLLDRLFKSLKNETIAGVMKSGHYKTATAAGVDNSSTNFYHLMAIVVCTVITVLV